MWDIYYEPIGLDMSNQRCGWDQRHADTLNMTLGPLRDFTFRALDQSRWPLGIFLKVLTVSGVPPSCHEGLAF